MLLNEQQNSFETSNQRRRPKENIMLSINAAKPSPYLHKQQKLLKLVNFL